MTPSGGTTAVTWSNATNVATTGPLFDAITKNNIT